MRNAAFWVILSIFTTLPVMPAQPAQTISKKRCPCVLRFEAIEFLLEVLFILIMTPESIKRFPVKKDQSLVL